VVWEKNREKTKDRKEVKEEQLLRVRLTEDKGGQIRSSEGQNMKNSGKDRGVADPADDTG